VPQWSKSTGGHLSEYNYAVETDDAGNILTTGYYFSSSLIFGNDTLLNNGSGFSDLFLTKYDPQGNVMWAKKAYGTRSESGYSVSTDPMQNVFMTGYFASPTLRFDTNNILNNHNPTASNQSGFDGFVVKYDGQGNILWSDCIGGTNYDFGADIFGDASGNQYVTGLYNSNTITFGSTVLPTGGNTNMFIAKLSGDMITQVPDLSQADQLTIYPNPSTGKFAIEGLAPGDSYALYSVGGQLLQKQTASSDNSEVDLRNYPKGIYFLSVAQGKKVLHRKLIRE